MIATSVHSCRLCMSFSVRANDPILPGGGEELLKERRLIVQRRLVRMTCSLLEEECFFG
jgi:hypothetical protein